MNETISTYDVFTPSTPAKLTYVERKSIVEKLHRGIKTTGKQIVIYGFSGSGKTTIVRNSISKYYNNIITTRCVKGMDIEDIFSDAFSQLEAFYIEGKEKNETSKRNYSLETNFFALKAQVSIENSEDSKEVFKRLVSLKVTPQTLAKFVGDTESCWIIEDFHKINDIEKEKLSQILKVFMDCSVDYPKLKIITIGAVNTAREIIQYDKEMKNRVTEIHVPLMKFESLAEIIKTGESLLNVRFENRVIEKIVRFSSGLPAVTHNLCLLICLNKGIEERSRNTSTIKFDVADLKKSINEFILESEDTYQSMYEKATFCSTNRNTNNPKVLLNALVDIDKEFVSYTEIKEFLNEKYYNNNSRKLREYLDEFTQPERDEILRHHKGTDSYYFSNPFFKSYITAKRFEELEKITLTKRLRVEKMSSSLDEMDLARQHFLKDFEDFEDSFYGFEDED